MELYLKHPVKWLALLENIKPLQLMDWMVENNWEIYKKDKKYCILTFRGDTSKYIRIWYEHDHLYDFENEIRMVAHYCQCCPRSIIDSIEKMEELKWDKKIQHLNERFGDNNTDTSDPRLKNGVILI